MIAIEVLNLIHHPIKVQAIPPQSRQPFINDNNTSISIMSLSFDNPYTNLENTTLNDAPYEVNKIS